MSDAFIIFGALFLWAICKNFKNSSLIDMALAAAIFLGPCFMHTTPHIILYAGIWLTIAMLVHLHRKIDQILIKLFKLPPTFN